MMTKKLAALLVAAGVVTIGGVQYLVANIKPTTTRADLLDAGITDECDPVDISCQVQDLCQNVKADGGLTARVRTVRVLAYQCARPGNTVPVLIPVWPKSGGQDCYRPVGPEDTACTVTGASYYDGGNPSVLDDLDRCVCRARGQMCRRFNGDGGVGIPLDFARTYDSMQAPYTGAGCTRTPCEGMSGEHDQVLNEDCR